MWTEVNICRGRENLRSMGMEAHVVMVPKGRTRWIGWPTPGTRGTGGEFARITSKRAATRFCREGRTLGLDIMFRLLLTLTKNIFTPTRAVTWTARTCSSWLFL